MPSGATKRRNTDTNRNYSETTDSDRNLLTANVIEWWKGGKAEQAAWLTGRLKAAEDDYGFYQLNTTGAAPITSKALVAVFSPAHAQEREARANRGTFRSPNMRSREDLTSYHASNPTHPPSVHGGYPTGNTQTAKRTPSMLERTLGEAADASS